MGDDRPKRSWREIDQAKEKARPRRDDRERARESASRSSSYSRYKSQLDQLFKPGGAQLPDHIRSQLGPESESSQQRRALADALKASPSDETLAAYLDAGQALPDDARVLMSLLGGKDESLMRPVLEKLLDVVESGRRPNRMLLTPTPGGRAKRRGRGRNDRPDQDGAGGARLNQDRAENDERRQA